MQPIGGRADIQRPRAVAWSQVAMRNAPQYRWHTCAEKIACNSRRILVIRNPFHSILTVDMP